MAKFNNEIITNTEVINTLAVSQEGGESDFAELRSINTIIENVPYYNVLASGVQIKSDVPFAEGDTLFYNGDVYEDNFAVVAYTGNGSTKKVITGIESYDPNYSASRTYTAGSGNNTEYAFDRATMKLWQYTNQNTDLVSSTNPLGDSSIVSKYLFDGNSDATVGGVNGIDTNVTYSTGVHGNSAVFNGSTSGIQLSNGMYLNSVGNGDLTIKLKFKVSNFNSSKLNMIFGNYFNENGVISIALYQNTIRSEYNGTTMHFQGNFTPSNDTWYDLVVIKKSGTWYVYIDGSSLSLSINADYSISNVRSFYVGRDEGGNYFFEGEIDQLEIYNKALSDFERAGVLNQQVMNWTEVADNVEIDFLSSQVWIKSRSNTYDNVIVDTLRGVGNEIKTNSTIAEGGDGNGVTSFNNDGFTLTLGTSTSYNNNAVTYIAWQKRYNKIKITTTNQGKRAIVAYDTEAGRSMTLYEGSGTIGHEIHNPLSIAVEANTIKNLDSVINWDGDYLGNRLELNQAGASVASVISNTVNNTQINATGDGLNNGTDKYIMYSEASVADQIKIGTYTGTGVAGNYVDCGFEPEHVIIKRVDGVQNWVIYDSTRSATNPLFPNLNNAEESYTDRFEAFRPKGFEVEGVHTTTNASGGTYLYIAYAKGSKTRKVVGTDVAQITGVSSNKVKNFAVKPYTGTGATQSIATGIASEDFTSTGNSSDYYLDRTTLNVVEKANRVTNGVFTSDVLGWTLEELTGSITSVGGKMRISVTGSTGSEYLNAKQTIQTKAGRRYRVNFKYAGDYAFVGVDGTQYFYNNGENVVETSETFTFLATGATSELELRMWVSGASTFEVDFDDVEVFELPDTGSIQLNTSKVHIKSRSDIHNNRVFDGLRGVNLAVFTDTTGAESLRTSELDSFDANGFTLGTETAINGSAKTFIAYQILYTHIRWGVTNHDTRYVEAYNPFTGEGMIIFEGGNGAGLEIPHSAGVAPDMIETKPLQTANAWLMYVGNEKEYLSTNTTAASAVSDQPWNNTKPTDKVISLGDTYASGDDYIMYYKVKSRNFTALEYTGTGAVGNYVETKDVDGVARRPRRVVIKRTDSAGGWRVFDSERDSLLNIQLDTSDAEASNNGISIKSTGFDLVTTNTDTNASGSKYLALIEFDTDGLNDDSYYTEYVGTHNGSVTPEKYMNTTDSKFEWSLDNGVQYHTAVPSTVSETNGTVTTTYATIQDLDVGNRDIICKVTNKVDGRALTKIEANIYKKG